MFDLELLNTLLNAGSIVAWVALFYLMLSKGTLVTRRENTLTLSLKDQIIAAKDQTIAEQRETIEDLSQVGELMDTFVNSVKTELNKPRSPEVQ